VSIEVLGDDYQNQGLIFPGEKAQPMLPWTLTRKLQRILRDTGLPHIRFHDLRHTCATLLLSKGVHPKFVAECTRASYRLFDPLPLVALPHLLLDSNHSIIGRLGLTIGRLP
jgi:integrase